MGITKTVTNEIIPIILTNREKIFEVSLDKMLKDDKTLIYVETKDAINNKNERLRIEIDSSNEQKDKIITFFREKSKNTGDLVARMIKCFKK